MATMRIIVNVDNTLPVISSDKVDMYKRIAKRMSSFELDFAIKDVQEVLQIWRDGGCNPDTLAKWWCEFDIYTAERQKRVRLFKRYLDEDEE